VGGGSLVVWARLYRWCTSSTHNLLYLTNLHWSNSQVSSVSHNLVDLPVSLQYVCTSTHLALRQVFAALLVTGSERGRFTHAAKA
jgi:hypothetical protein